MTAPSLNLPFDNPMTIALDEARLAAAAGEVPIGAVIVCDGQIIARGQNRTRRDKDPTAHAEIVAIRAASSAKGNFRLGDCDLFVTLEPCAMCAGAIGHARIARLYFGAEDEKSGGTYHGARVFEHSQSHHHPEIYGGIGESAAAALLEDFFATLRQNPSASRK